MRKTTLPWAGISFAFFTLENTYISCIQIWLSFVAKSMGIAQITINIVIWTLSTQLVIKSPFAISTTETFLVVQSSFGSHFLRLKYLNEKKIIITFNTTLFLEKFKKLPILDSPMSINHAFILIKNSVKLINFTEFFLLIK